MRKIFIAVAIAGLTPGVLLAKNGEVKPVQACGLTTKRQPDLVLKEANGRWEETTGTALRTCADCRRWANAWHVKNGTVVELGEAAESGDWTQWLTYCFNDKGETTRAQSEFRSAHGWAARQYYRANSSKLLLTETHFFGNTNIEITEPADWENYRDLHGSIPSYTKIEQLPIAELSRCLTRVGRNR